MSVSINNNMLSLNIANTYNRNVVGLQNSMYKVSSGQKINDAGDDPAGIGISERLRTRIQSVDQANRNIQNDSAIMKIADNSLTNLSEILSSIREKIVQASDSNITTDERTNLSADVTQLISDYTNVLNDAKYGGKSFFGASDSYAGSATTDGFTVQYGADSGDKVNLQFSKLDTTTLGITSGQIAGWTTAAAANGKISAVDVAANRIAAEQAKVGGYERRLGYMADNTVNERTALTQMESSVRDTDVAQGMTDFMKYNIRTQASQLMLAQAGQVPAMVLQLLQP